MTPEPDAASAQPTTKTYRLKDGIVELVRAGIALDAYGVAKLTAAEAAKHAEYLEEGVAREKPKPKRGGA